jgi:hypothetical protein
MVLDAMLEVRPTPGRLGEDDAWLAVRTVPEPAARLREEAACANEGAGMTGFAAKPFGFGKAAVAEVGYDSERPREKSLLLMRVRFVGSGWWGVAVMLAE